MNEFTKEELKEILACVCNIDGNVLNKIQSMIDNYCEHECSNHELIRLKLLRSKEYDFCETCLCIRRMR